MIKIKSPKGIDCLSLIQRANSNKIFHHKEASARLALEEKVILWISNHESVNLNKSGYVFAKLLGSNQKEGKTKSSLIIQHIEMAPHGKLNQIKTMLRCNESVLLWFLSKLAIWFYYEWKFQPTLDKFSLWQLRQDLSSAKYIFLQSMYSFKIAGLAKGLSCGTLLFLLHEEVTLSLFPTDITIFPCTLILITLPRLASLDLGSLGRQDIGSSVHWQQGEYP